MRFFGFLVSALMLGVSASATAAPGDFRDCQQFFVAGRVPVIIQNEAQMKTRALCFNSFAILHSGTSKSPVYAVQRLNRALLQDAKGNERTDHFYEEARLPSAERALLSDFKSSGFDRGHLAEAAAQPDAASMAQSFSLANMVMQSPQLNRGVWAKSVEKATRQYAMRAKGDVYVFTGPVFQAPVQKVGAGQVWVPTYLYKLVYDATTNRAWAHFIENKDDARAGRPISYQELVKRTGIEFLPGIPVRD